LDGVVGGLAEDAMRRVVDHAFVRSLELLGIVVMLLVIGALGYRRFIRK